MLMTLCPLSTIGVTEPKCVTGFPAADHTYKFCATGS